MPDFTLPELNADQGTNTGNNLRNAANAAANAVCSLYQNAPTGLIPSVGDPFGIGAFNQGLFDNLCRPRNQIPPNPSPPFSGGQCPVLYDVSYQFSGDGVPNGSGTVRLLGKIGRLTMNLTSSDNGYKRFTGTITSGSPPFNIVTGLGGLNNGQANATGSITSIVRVDGMPDNCGNPAPVYPTRDPLPSDYELAPMPIGDRGNIVNVPVVIIPTLIRPTIDFRPEINVKVGDLNINFNLGGVDISLNPSPTLPPQIKPDGKIPSPIIDPRPVPPVPIPPKAPSVKCPDIDLTEVLDLLEDIKECACEVDTVVLTQDFGQAKGASIQLPVGAFYVVLLVTPTANVRYQASEGNSPDLFYAGWLSFGFQNSYGVRNRVDFTSTGFPVPDGATSFSYSLVFNSTAIARVYRRVPVENT